MSERTLANTRMLGDKLLVETLEKVGTTSGGIALPESVVEDGIFFAMVIRAGPGVQTETAFHKTDCKPGDVVAFRNSSLLGKLRIEFDEFAFIFEREVVAYWPRMVPVAETEEDLGEDQVEDGAGEMSRPPAEAYEYKAPLSEGGAGDLTLHLGDQEPVTYKGVDFGPPDAPRGPRPDVG